MDPTEIERPAPTRAASVNAPTAQHPAAVRRRWASARGGGPVGDGLEVDAQSEDDDFVYRSVSEGGSGTGGGPSRRWSRSTRSCSPSCSQPCSLTNLADRSDRA